MTVNPKAGAALVKWRSFEHPRQTALTPDRIVAGLACPPEGFDSAQREGKTEVGASQAASPIRKGNDFFRSRLAQVELNDKGCIEVFHRSSRALETNPEPSVVFLGLMVSASV